MKGGYFINSSREEVPSMVLDKFRVNFWIDNCFIYINLDAKYNDKFNFWGTKSCKDANKCYRVVLSDEEARNIVIDAYNKGYFQINNFDSHTIEVIKYAIDSITKQESSYDSLGRMHK